MHASLFRYTTITFLVGLYDPRNVHETHSYRFIAEKTTKPMDYGTFIQCNGIYTDSYLTSCFECALRRSEVVWRLSVPKSALSIHPRSSTQCIGHACSMAPYARVGGRAGLWSLRDVITTLPIHSPPRIISMVNVLFVMQISLL